MRRPQPDVLEGTSRSSPKEAGRHLSAVGLILASVFLVYANSLRNGFVWDDHIYIEANPFVADPGNLKVFLSPAYYLGAAEVLVASRPVFLATLMTDRALWGLAPSGYHATSLLLHALNSAGVYALASSFSLPPPAPLFAGLVFGLHPIQTEAVDAVSFRADLLSAFFVLGSLGAYLASRKNLRWLSLSAALFGLGLLSKEMAATVPALVLFFEFYLPSGKQRAPRLALAFVSFFLIGCAFAGFWTGRFHYSGLGAPNRLQAAAEGFASSMPTAGVPGLLRSGLEKEHILAPTSSDWAGLYADRRAAVLTMIGALGGYLRLLVVPHPLVADRAPVVIRAWTEGAFLLSLAALVLVALCAWRWRREHPACAFGAAWFLTSLAPVSGLIPLYNPVAERYLYLATAGAALAAAPALSWLWRRAWGRLSCVLLLTAFGARVFVRNKDWASDSSLFLKRSAGVPQSSRANFIRAGLLKEGGRLGEAAAQYKEALRLNPGFAEAWLGLGAVLGARGDVRGTEESLEKAIAAVPTSAVLRFSYALLLANAKRTTRAVEMYRQALKLDPSYTEAWVNLGALYRDSGRYKEARVCYLKAVSFAAADDPVPFYSFAALLEKTGDLEDAARLYRSALKRDPSFKQAHWKLGLLLARLGRSRESSDELDRARRD